MLLGPVFNAEMVTTARKRRYFLLRVLFGLGLLLLLWTSVMGVRNGRDVGGELDLDQSAELAQAFYMSFSWATLIGTLLVVPGIAAGTIATERDRRTIEYLFATDLSNTEIVLSKIFAKLLLVGKLLLVSLPVLAIFRMLGGIPGNLLLAYFAMLGSTCFFVITLSLSVSVWTNKARDAVIRTYILMVAILALPALISFLLAAIAAFAPGTSPVLDFAVRAMGAINSINPIVVYGEATLATSALGFGVNFGMFANMVFWHLLLGAALATLSVLVVRRVHLNSLGKVRSSSDSLPSLPSFRFRPGIGNHPMLWKELFARTASVNLGIVGRIAMGLIMAATVGIACFSYYWIVFENSNSWQDPWEAFMITTVFTNVLYGSGIVLLVGARAAGLVSFEKERDCWLSLIATPLNGSEIIFAKVLGNLYAFRWLPLPMFFVWLLQFTLSPIYLFTIGLNLLTLTLCSAFASCVGVAFSLKLSTSLKAIGATLGTVIMVGGGYFLCCCIPVLIASDGGNDLEISLALVVPCLFAWPSVWLVENEDWFIPTYVIGIISYGIATAVIYGNLVHSFDAIVGRTSERPFQPGELSRPIPATLDDSESS